MKWLAKIGFARSDDYFMWRLTKEELKKFVTDGLEGLMATDMRWTMIGKNCPTTADNLLEPLRDAEPYEFLRRILIASALSSLYEIFWGYEQCLNKGEGAIEFKDSEKYERWDWPAAIRQGLREGNIAQEIRRVNEIRRENPALRIYDNLQWHETLDPSQIMVVSRATADSSNIIVTAVNLQQSNQESWARVRLPIEDWGIKEGERYQAHDLLNGRVYEQNSAVVTIILGGEHPLAQIFRIEREGPQPTPGCLGNVTPQLDSQMKAIIARQGYEDIEPFPGRVFEYNGIRGVFRVLTEVPARAPPEGVIYEELRGNTIYFYFFSIELL